MKNRKLRWGRIALAAGLILAMSGRMMAEAKQETEERTATIMVMSITGNELTYYEIQEESETEQISEETRESETERTSEEETQENETETAQKSGTEMPQDNESMTPPEGISQDGEAMTPPKGMSQDGEAMTPPEGMPQDNESMTPPEGMSQDNESTAQPKEFQWKDVDTKTVYLPVPVVVHTDTDEKRTFSILEAGDKLQVTIVTDEDGNETITEIWMLSEDKS